MWIVSPCPAGACATAQVSERQAALALVPLLALLPLTASTYQSAATLRPPTATAETHARTNTGRLLIMIQLRTSRVDWGGVPPCALSVRSRPSALAATGIPRGAGRPGESTNSTCAAARASNRCGIDENLREPRS